MDITKSSVALAWSRPKDDGGSAIIGYFVEYKVLSAETWSRNEMKITSTMFTQSGLTPDADYQFRVVAVNSVGESEPGPISGPVTCKDPFGELKFTCLLSKYDKKYVEVLICHYLSRQAQPTRRN